MHALSDCGLPQFTFAGFSFPRYLATMPRGTLAQRLHDSKSPYRVGGYYHAPTPNNATGIGFYLGSDSSFDLRHELVHSAYYADRFYSDTIQGVVFRLPKGRGFLAGWTMGDGMASSVDFDIFDNFDDAARCAESMAQNAAERAIEDDDAFRAAQDEEEREAELTDAD